MVCWDCSPTPFLTNQIPTYFDQFIEVLSYVPKLRDFAAAQVMPLGAVLLQGTSTRRLEHCQPQREHVSLRQVCVVVMKHLHREVAGVTLLDTAGW